jgi:hypothetical protein
VFNGATLVLLAVPVSPFRNTKTDQTLGRSVALLAQLHPKCPFQVKPRRVRAFLDDPVVRKYYSRAGL